MTRFKVLRRIEAAIAHRNEEELRWALGQCELRKGFQRAGHSSRWYRIEKEIRAVLEALKNKE